MTDKAKPKVPSSERNPDVAEPTKQLDLDQAHRELMEKVRRVRTINYRRRPERS